MRAEFDWIDCFFLSEKKTFIIKELQKKSWIRLIGDPYLVLFLPLYFRKMFQKTRFTK